MRVVESFRKGLCPGLVEAGRGEVVVMWAKDAWRSYLQTPSVRQASADGAVALACVPQWLAIVDKANVDMNIIDVYSEWCGPCMCECAWDALGAWHGRQTCFGCPAVYGR